MNRKRRYKRVPISASVTITCDDEGRGETVHAMAANISLSGIGLYSDSPLEPETDVSLAVNFISMSGGISTDVVKGNIVYVKEIGGMYFMGVVFAEEVNRTGQPFLYEHLMSILITD